MSSENTPVFTRYLYIKSEVEVSLLVSILEKKNDAALFWAYELFYSGFANEVIPLLWRVYFEFFATLNPAFEAYFWKKQQESGENTLVLLIAGMVNNLCRRKFNTDVFFLREVSMNFEMEKPYPTLKECLATNNYEAIAHHIVEVGKDDLPETLSKLQDIAKTAAIYFKEKGLKEKPFKPSEEMVKYVNAKIILITRIMQYFVQLNQDIKLGKSLYLSVDIEDLVMYDTVEATSDFPPRKILDFACAYSPETTYLNMFHCNRIDNIMLYFRKKWLYYAEDSPIWKERILEHEGKLDHTTQEVVFDDDDKEEAFYNSYSLEPDEQPVTVVEKIVPPIIADKNVTWPAFYNKFGAVSQSLYKPGEEELEAL
jgi:hypothetical protein